MAKPLPPLPPHIQQKAEQAMAGAQEVLDRYIAGIELDMNRHAVKHGPMAPERAHHDVTMMLARDVPPNMLAAITAEAILRGIARKRQGKA